MLQAMDHRHTETESKYVTQIFVANFNRTNVEPVV